MTKYHINPQTGKPNICRAQTPDSCKFYSAQDGPPPHFDSKEEAQAHYEKSREDDTFSSVSNKFNDSKPEKVNHAVKNYGALSEDIVNAAEEYGYEPAKVVEDYDDIDNIGVRAATIKGAGFGGLMYDETQVSGTINYHSLDENSYKRFGFKGSDEQRDSFVASPTTTAYQMMFEEGEGRIIRAESDQLDSDEKTFTNLYSSDSGWINKGIYSDCKTPEDYTGDYFTMLPPEILCYDEDYNEYIVKGVTDDKIDKNLHDGVCRGLDIATQSDIGVQRTVYRGIGKDDPLMSDGTRLKDCSLGQEITFDAFTSTSSNPNVSLLFSSREEKTPTILEIKSGSGVFLDNEASTSDYETEVLLPRGSRFMVVGKQQVDKKKLRADEYSDQKVNVVQLVEINEEGEIVDQHNIKKTNAMRFNKNNENSKIKWNGTMSDEGLLDF